jgi:hypothetical protein
LTELRILGAGDAALLGRLAEDVFDQPIVPALLAEFLDNPRHHLCVARRFRFQSKVRYSSSGSMNWA